jgi:hypothetical protein
MAGFTDIERLMSILDRPIAFHRCFVTVSGSVTAAVMLSQALYWTQRTPEDRNGWFYKTQKEWESETGLTRSEQETARRRLREIGILEERKEGIPCKLYFRINRQNLYSRLLDSPNLDSGKASAQNAGIPQTGGDGFDQPVCRNPANNLYTENTTENTAENTYIDTPLAPQGEFVEEEIPKTGFCDPEEEIPDRILETLRFPEEINQPLSLGKNLGVEKISPAAAKKSKPSDADFDIFREVWNSDRPTHWAECQSLNKDRIKALRRFTSENGDRSLEIFQNALAYARQDRTWCLRPDVRLAIDNFLTHNKPVQWAERLSTPSPDGAYVPITDRGYAEEFNRIYSIIEESQGQRIANQAATIGAVA